MVNKTTQQKSSGFTTLLFVMITGFTFLILLSVAARSAGRIQSEIMANQYRLIAIATAGTCRQVVIAKLLETPSYRGGETIGIGSNTCDIDAFTPNGRPPAVTVEVSANAHGYIYTTESKVTFTGIELNAPTTVTGGTSQIEATQSKQR
jgi:hypothetical protein